MTGVQINYDAVIDLSLVELLAMASAARADIPAGAAGGASDQLVVAPIEKAPAEN